MFKFINFRKIMIYRIKLSKIMKYQMENKKINQTFKIY